MEKPIIRFMYGLDGGEAGAVRFSVEMLADSLGDEDVATEYVQGLLAEGVYDDSELGEQIVCVFLVEEDDRDVFRAQAEQWLAATAA